VEQRVSAALKACIQCRLNRLLNKSRSYQGMPSGYPKCLFSIAPSGALKLCVFQQTILAAEVPESTLPAAP
jgi:hypothetical protein